VLNGRRCSSCSVWRHKHPGEAGCAGCGRILAVKDGYCRLCLYLAWQRGEARGWRRGLRFAVRRTLIIVLSRHQPGDTVRYSEIIPLRQALGIRAGRTAEVLQEMGVLHDDRRPSFEDWLERKLDGLAPGIRADAEAWLRTRHDGGPRSRPRDIATAWNHMHYIRPVLLEWSSQYGHLREVTCDDIQAALGKLHGTRRSNVLVALRSLFASCKKQKTIFRSPVQGIRVGERTHGIIQPLSQEEIDEAAEAATTPEARLGLVLAAMHAARAKAIREIRLDDIDLGNQRIVIGGRARPLDDLTRQVLLEWLAHRSARWPSTANPYLLVNQRSANGTGPVSTSYFATAALRGKAATLERLRVDRQLQEALAFGPDPLHLASMFGLDPKAAICYAENARQLLITAAEEQDPSAGTSTSGGQATGRTGKDAGAGR
jgi:integrase